MPDFHVGIEIGSSKVCVAVGEQAADGLMKILYVGETASTGIRSGEIVDADAASSCMRAALKTAEENSDVIIRDVHLATLGGLSEYGSGRRAKNGILCLEQLGLEVCDVALPVIPCESAVLSSEEKERGVLMLDLGAAQTGHVVYANGENRDWGWQRTGSAHVTDDLAKRLRITWEHAERLKIENGNAFICRSSVNAPGSWNVHERHADYGNEELMQEIIYLRLRAVLEKTKKRLISKGVRLGEIRAGVHLTGGGSRQRGILELASEVFGLPACLARAKGFVWNDGVVESPQHSCAIGLLKLSEWRGECDPISHPGRRYFGLIPE